MKAPRGLTAEEAEAWAKLAASVTPLVGERHIVPPLQGEAAPRSGVGGVSTLRVTPLRQPFGLPPPSSEEDRKPSPGLDSHWERRLRAGALQPDFTLDLHGHGLDSAHGRLMGGMAQARAMGARVVLLVTGKERPVDPADRATRRGAIRAKVLDWLAASSHSAAIAAIRKAHRRHGGDGALYIVLRRKR